jgi:plasmid maintenance system antidote protein VapI
LAISLAVPANRISGKINGDRAITGETAILFAKAFNTTPEFWIVKGAKNKSGASER